MASEQIYYQYFNKAWESFFFAHISERTIFLICGFQPVTVQLCTIKRHFSHLHSQYASYEGREKLDLIEGLKLVNRESLTYIRNRASNRARKSEQASSSNEARNASYAISFLIAKNSKPFSDGTFIQKGLIETIKSFGGSITLEQAETIPLIVSRRTVTRRISDISVYFEQKLRALLNTCTYFSLCLDESTDRRHTS